MMTSILSARRNDFNADSEAKSLLERLDAGVSLVLTAWPTLRLASVLAASIDRRTAHGKTTAILADGTSRLEQLSDLELLCDEIEGEFRPRKYTRSSFLNDLGSAISEEWFDHLDLVLIPCVEDTLRRPFEWEHLCYRIIDRCTDRGLVIPQFVLVISHRDLAEPALRRNFPVLELNQRYVNGQHVPHEAAFGGIPVRKIWWTMWAAEDAYLPKLMKTDTAIDYGVEPVLAYFAGARQITPSYYLVDSSISMEDQLEAFQSRLMSLRKRPWSEFMVGCSDGYFVRTNSCSAESIRVDSGNPWPILRSLSENGGDSLLVNIVVPPTLLRGYLLANASYFSCNPIEPLTPRMLNSLNDAIAQLYLRMKQSTARIALDEVRRILVRAKGGYPKMTGDIFFELQELFKSAFGVSVANRLRTVVTNQWETTSDGMIGGFTRRTWVVLDSACRGEEVDWLHELRIESEGNLDAEIVRRDHVHQLYSRGQQCCIAGKLFRVEAVELETVRVRKVAELPVITRRELDVKVGSKSNRHLVEAHAPASGHNYIFRCEVFELPFVVSCQARWESVDYGSSWERFEDKLPLREYRFGRAVRVFLSDLDSMSIWTPSQRLALVQFLNESARTLLPESFPFFIATTYVSEEQLPESRIAHSLTPKLAFSGEDEAIDLTSIWVFEDSHADMGIVGAFKDRVKWLLGLCLDYISWRFDEGSVAYASGSLRLNESRLQRDFLTYGEEKIDPAFDFDGLRKSFERCSLFVGRNGISENRHQVLEQTRKNEVERNGVGHSNEGHRNLSGAVDCDFCGENISTQGEVLDDERHRCGTCSQTAVDNPEQAQYICQEVIANVSRLFRIQLSVSVKIRFASASQIAHELGEHFLPTSSFDQRAIGLAMMRGERDYEVFLERGHPALHLAMTLAHELTHIWQYMWLDYQRMESEHGKVLIEGHASWVEIAYARAMMEEARESDNKNAWAAVLQRHEKGLLQRQDEYGQGYRRLMQAVGIDGDVFLFLGALYRKAI